MFFQLDKSTLWGTGTLFQFGVRVGGWRESRKKVQVAMWKLTLDVPELWCSEAGALRRECCHWLCVCAW